MPIDLADKPILITGASSGIGLATALACARAGMPVALAARRADRLHDAVARITASGARALALPLDVTDPDACAGAIAHAADALGTLYAVFANAGVGLSQPTLDTSDDQFRQLFETNFFGTLHTIRPAIERFRAARQGHVLICSSCLSKSGLPRSAAYSASKAMQDHLGRALRHELAREGVHVSTVHPIGTRTEFFDVARAHTPDAPPPPRTPHRFMQDPEVVARAVVACLRRPRGEVWTSLPMRLALGAGVAFPSLLDAFLARRARARGR